MTGKDQLSMSTPGEAAEAFSRQRGLTECAEHDEAYEQEGGKGVVEKFESKMQLNSVPHLYSLKRTLPTISEAVP